MRVVVADDDIATLCENPRAGADALGPRGYDSMTLVLDLIAPATVTFRALETLSSVALEFDGHPATHVVIMTEYVRMTFRSVAHPSGDAVMFDPTHQLAPLTLQLLEVVAMAAPEAGSRKRRSARA
jgi:hypothetical protein